VERSNEGLPVMEGTTIGEGGNSPLFKQFPEERTMGRGRVQKNLLGGKRPQGRNLAFRGKQPGVWDGDYRTGTFNNGKRFAPPKRGLKNPRKKSRHMSKQ